MLFVPIHDPLKFFGKWAWHFWGLYANCSNTVKDMDFKFHKHVPSDRGVYRTLSTVGDKCAMVIFFVGGLLKV